MDTSLVVTAIRPLLLSAPYAPGEELRWVGGMIRSWDAALVEVCLSDGTRGVGEAGAGIMAALAVPGLVDAYRSFLLERVFEHPLDVGDHLRAMTAFWSRGGIASGVAGAIELACIDAVGVREGVPAYELLGGLHRPSIEIYASGGLGDTFDEVLVWANAQRDAGFDTVKFRAMRDPDTTIRLVEEIIPRLAGQGRFVLDAVQGCAGRPWSIDDAIRVGQVAADAGARWFEEPAHATDPGGYATVRAALSVPISGVESHATFEDFRVLLEAGGVDIAQPDATFVGGPAVFARIAALAASTGVATVPHVWGSGVTLMANLHTVLARPEVELFEYCTLPNPLRESLLVEPLRREGSALVAPSAPGLGIRVTPAIEQQFPFVPTGGHVIRT
jgi:L-alanine-DL-glutamate epimerase-like enolase superfamily enzyme